MDAELKQYFKFKADAIHMLLTGRETFEFSGVISRIKRAEDIASKIPSRKMPIRFLLIQIYFVIKEFFKRHEY